MRRSAAGLVAIALLAAPALASGQPTEGLGVDESALLGPPHGTALSGEALDRATAELGSKMRCPVCQGLSIADSPAASAVSMLAQVRDLFASGYTDEQILDYFESTYGEFVLLAPRAEGVNLIVWVAPVAALLFGVGVLVRLRRRDTGVAETSAQELQSYLDRVRAESRGAPEERS